MATGFVPSVNGLRFTNSWPEDARVTILGVPVGSAARGLCGGMVFTALDVFTAGRPPLCDGLPAPGSPLFEYIVRRLIESWNIPGGVLEYYRGMVSRTPASEWAQVKAELDAGRPCPLGLVTVRSADPRHLGQNHQVLAYGYDEAGLRVYDPNTDLAVADDVRIQLDPSGSGSGSGRVTGHNVAIDRPIRSFFIVAYKPVRRPPVSAG